MSINAAFVNAAKDPRDGMVPDIQLDDFTTVISSGVTGNVQSKIPASGSCLKSLFFVHTYQALTNIMNYIKTGFQHRGHLQYRVVVGRIPLNTDYISF